MLEQQLNILQDTLDVRIPANPLFQKCNLLLICISYMQPVKGATKIITFKKSDTHRYHSQHHIPSRQQASERQSGLKTFHMRKTHMKRKSLQGICKQNFRLYFCINKQKSSYQNLFADKHTKKQKAKDSARYSNCLQQLTHKQQVQFYKEQLRKVTRLKELLNGKQNICESKKRQYTRYFRANRSVTCDISKIIKKAQINQKSD